MYTFEGSAYVQIGDSPTGYESMYYRATSCDLTGCGLKVKGSLVSASFVNGIATFEVRPIIFIIIVIINNTIVVVVVIIIIIIIIILTNTCLLNTCVLTLLLNHIHIEFDPTYSRE